MKHFFVILTLFISGSIFAQDQIITIKPDTINCFITKEKNGYVYFIVAGKDSTQAIKSLLPIAQIQSIKREYYSTLAPAVIKKKAKEYKYPRTWMRLEGGYSRRLARNPDNVPSSELDYYKELKNGFCLGGDFTYFLDKRNGIGLKYSLHRSKASADISISNNGGIPVNATVRDNIFINYFGLTYTFRFLSDHNPNVPYIRGSLGLAAYRNDVYFIQSADLKAQTLGTSLDFGYDMMIAEKTGISFGFDISTGYYEKFTITDTNGNSASGEYESGKGDNLVRLNLTIGIVFK